ncbi:MAG: hypothetical protein RLZZ350_1112 [Verrucomicrobiota bacterium]
MKPPLVIVSGALATKPGNGGNAWTRMSWARGFEQLGCEVWFIEQLPATMERGVHAASINFFQTVTAQFGLTQNSALLWGNEVLVGPPLADLVKRVQNAALLFNLSGHLSQPELFAAARSRLYYDDDPGFTQFWHAQGANLRLANHDFHFTIGENIGTPNYTIPTSGINWRHTRAPVVLADWPVCAPKKFDRFTTIASWRGAFGSVTHEKKTYGLKCHEFRKFLELPRLVKNRLELGNQETRKTPAFLDSLFEIALQIHPADKKDLDALITHGWRVIEPHTVAGSCDSFRSYVQNSAAEFSPAQSIYVETNSGWFSDRTVRYLASGRPALVQETGFSQHVKTGAGLLSFRNLDEAVESAEKIARDYAAHCRAARAVAEEFFDADKIIRRLAAEISLPLPR